jgi:hypothetical protein
VGPRGIEVVKPAGRKAEDVPEFLSRNRAWVLNQLERVDRLRNVRRAKRQNGKEILFRGVPTIVRIELTGTQVRGNLVGLGDGAIIVRRGAASQTPKSSSLETWLRKQARIEIEKHLSVVTERLRQKPRRVYVMGQRTKWGNCSRERNLSFNWRLILAPDFVLRYLVTHEAVHLAVPDHSAKFWLTVQSLCRESERAKQLLSANSHKVWVDLGKACGDSP